MAVERKVEGTKVKAVGSLLDLTGEVMRPERGRYSKHPVHRQSQAGVMRRLALDGRKLRDEARTISQQEIAAIKSSGDSKRG